MNIFAKKMKIGTLPWHIKELSPDREDVSGECTNVFHHTLYVKKEKGMEELDTLLHEMLHAADAMHNIKLTEKQVYILAEALTFILRDNPWLFTYVKEKIKEEYPS